MFQNKVTTSVANFLLCCLILVFYLRKKIWLPIHSLNNTKLLRLTQLKIQFETSHSPVVFF